MATLTWHRDPIDPNPRVGYFVLEGYNRTYHLSMGDGAMASTARPARQPHAYNLTGLFRAVARTRAGGDLLDDILVNIPDDDAPAPEVAIHQYANRPYLDTPPYYLGNLELVITNADTTFLNAYTIDWGGPSDYPEPARKSVWATPDLVVRGQQEEGTYTATITHEATNITTEVDYTVTPEVEVTFTTDTSVTSGLAITAELTRMVDLRPDEDSNLVAVNIDWGDGQGRTQWKPAVVGDTTTHTYTNPGTYEVWVDRMYDRSGQSYKTVLTVPIPQEEK